MEEKHEKASHGGTAPESLVEKILRRIDHASRLYHRLIILTAPTGMGKTALLQDIHKRAGFPLVNVNLAMSQRMLDLTERQRALQAPRLLSEIVEITNETSNSVALLDNIEILFDISLKQDPLRLLQGLSRNKTVVAAWNGVVDNGKLVYAEPGHREYRRYQARDLQYMDVSAA